MITTTREGHWLKMNVPPNWAGHSVDYILRQIWKAPKKHIHTLRMNKEVLVNNVPANWVTPLLEKDLLNIKMFSDTPQNVRTGHFDINVIYEDDHMLILNKPSHMDTHPNEPQQMNTLINGATYYLQKKGERCQLKHIHRLDRDTTGAVLFAKHALAGSILDRMLEERLIKRTYVALVHGIMKKEKGTIKEPIGRDRHHATRRRVSKGGQQAITHYEVVQKDTNQQLTLVKCELDTGRTHQIRVHFSYIGHPLAGDQLYGGNAIFSRQALHAVKMEFQHPFTEELITCHAPFLDEPAIFKRVDSYKF
ncbi:RluA family pseudouridine synthase [Bacillus sp. 03113]|uniref:RluA family pseudouridine synthase n=1 Tax=Bacillus sp. 03113 TaxID=2578211 RepID=UPI0011439C5B|nr:RluA family pseudouridine synthase [Bacillus sp. 03113]